MKSRTRFGGRVSVKFLKISLLTALAFSTPVSASEFSESYKAYKQAVIDNDSAARLKYSQRTYELAFRMFGPTSIDTAKLGVNWANAMVMEGKGELANSIFVDALDTYRIEYGDSSKQILDPLIGAAQTTADEKESRKQFELAIDIAYESEDTLLYADTLSAAFASLSKTKLYNRTIRDYALDAYEIYERELPKDSLVRTKAAFIAGGISFVEMKDDKAIVLLNEVVKQFSVLDYTHPYELKAHAYLVELYERQGESGKSTEHCIAIGSMRPWLEEQEQLPLYRLPPKYPVSAAKMRKEGWVKVEFTVDEQGFVINPEVIDNKGHAAFKKSAIKALKKWRYAPKFVDGKAVAAQAQVQLDYTLMGDY